MATTANPQVRRGLCAWGLTHRLKYTRVEKLFKVDCIYQVRIRLPKYIRILLRNRAISAAHLQGNVYALRNRIMSYTDTTGEVKCNVPDINCLVEQPEMTVFITVENDIYNKPRIAGILRKIMEYIRMMIDVYRDIMYKGLEEKPVFHGYKLTKTGGLYYSVHARKVG